MKKEIEPNTYIFKKLKEKYPDNEKFYKSYHEGGYLNVDYTEYFDENKQFLESESHGNYG